MSTSTAPSTMLRMVPLPRFAGEDLVSWTAGTAFLPCEAGEVARSAGGGDRANTGRLASRPGLPPSVLPDISPARGEIMLVTVGNP